MSLNVNCNAYIIIIEVFVEHKLGYIMKQAIIYCKIKLVLGNLYFILYYLSLLRASYLRLYMKYWYVIFRVIYERIFKKIS